jgi:hypothetical protein
VRRRGYAGRLLLAAALAPLIALAAVVVAASLLTGTRAGSPAPATRPASPAGPVPAGMPQVPRTDLAGLTWAGYHGVELPSSPEAGPRDTAGGLAWGFADTPLGALLAALNIAVRANAQWGPGIFGPVIRRQVTGPDTAALLAGCQAAYGQAARAAHIAGGAPLGSAYVTEQAFRWVTYTPADATVDLVSAGPGSQGLTVRAVTRVEVTWDGTDWQVVAPPGGDWGNAAASLPSLDGYTVFPGQG